MFLKSLENYNVNGVLGLIYIYIYFFIYKHFLLKYKGNWMHDTGLSKIYVSLNGDTRVNMYAEKILRDTHL